MIKYAPVTTLMSTILFVAINFTTSKFQDFSRNVQIGYPFTFFSTESESIIGATKQFSALNLGADFLLVFALCAAVVKIYSLGARPAKKGA